MANSQSGPSQTASPSPGVWLQAARPKTLVAGVVPVLVGTAASGQFLWVRFLLALVVAVSLQVAVNFANDYFDAVKGVDDETRLGPPRAVASGLISPSTMKIAIAAILFIAGFAGGLLALSVGPELFVVGAVILIATLGYSGGPRPYGSAALGELFVFVFFGLVATAGAAYVQIEEISTLAVAASVPIGLLAAAILVANNLRDISTDQASGKTTLAVKLGTAGSVRLFRAMLVAAYLALSLVLLAGSGPPALLALFSIPLAVSVYRRVGRVSGRGLIEVLVATARLELVFGAMLAAGLVIE